MSFDFQRIPEIKSKARDLKGLSSRVAINILNRLFDEGKEVEWKRLISALSKFDEYQSKVVALKKVSQAKTLT